MSCLDTVRTISHKHNFMLPLLQATSGEVNRRRKIRLFLARCTCEWLDRHERFVGTTGRKVFYVGSSICRFLVLNLLANVSPSLTLPRRSYQMPLAHSEKWTLCWSLLRVRLSREYFHPTFCSASWTHLQNNSGSLKRFPPPDAADGVDEAVTSSNFQLL